MKCQGLFGIQKKRSVSPPKLSLEILFSSQWKESLFDNWIFKSSLVNRWESHRLDLAQMTLVHARRYSVKTWDLMAD